MGAIWPNNGSGGGGGGGGGSGISGLTAGRTPIADTPTKLKDAPWARSYTGDGTNPQREQLIVDGGSTNGNGAINIRPSSGSGCYGASLSFDNNDIDGAASVLWNFLALDSATSFQKWFGLMQQVNAILLVSPDGNVYMGDTNGDFHDSRLTVHGNIKLTGGGKILYTPAIGGDWSGTPPTTVEDAIDRLALWMQLNGGGPLP